MQSLPNKFNRTFASLFPSICKPKTDQSQKLEYQLTNEGCKCQMCQKIIINENLKILTSEITDFESEQFSKDSSKEHFIELIEQFHTQWKFKRNLRFCLPQVCLFKDAHPYALIQKKKQSMPISINKSKSRLHFFQIQNFFLTSYIAHSPAKKSRQSKNEASFKAYVNECIALAKYDGNFYHMLTYKEIEGMFRSKNKGMKNGLMYLQTIVGGDAFCYRTVIVKLDDIETNSEMKTLFERAKLQVRIISGQIKLTDGKYFQESEEIAFENDLRNFDVNRYLLYLSYKIILISSKLNPEMMKNVIFKYAVIDKKVFLFDVRVKQYGSCLKYWKSNVMQALQMKLKKTMSLMQLQNSGKEEKYGILQNQLSSKAQQLSDWLQMSTEGEWQEMRAIRKRLERLEQEKKSLQNSKKDQQLRKTFKLRSIQNKKHKQKEFNIDHTFI